jgi:hypothetical protein
MREVGSEIECHVQEDGTIAFNSGVLVKTSGRRPPILIGFPLFFCIPLSRYWNISDQATTASCCLHSHLFINRCILGRHITRDSVSIFEYTIISMNIIAFRGGTPFSVVPT